MQIQPQVLQTYGFLNFLQHRYPKDQVTFLLIQILLQIFVHLFIIYLFIHLFIYLFMYLFIYLCIIYLFSFFHLYRKLRCDRETLRLSLVGYLRGFKWKNIVDI